MSVDDIAFQSLSALLGAGVRALLMYMCLLDVMPSALSNQVPQLGIFNSAPSLSFTPIVLSNWRPRPMQCR